MSKRWTRYRVRKWGGGVGCGAGVPPAGRGWGFSSFVVTTARSSWATGTLLRGNQNAETLPWDAERDTAHLLARAIALQYNALRGRFTWDSSRFDFLTT